MNFSNIEIRDFMSDVPERKAYREIIPIGCKWHGLKKCDQCSGGFHLGVGVADRWYLWLAASWKLKFLEWSLRQR